MLSEDDKQERNCPWEIPRDCQYCWCLIKYWRNVNVWHGKLHMVIIWPHTSTSASYDLFLLEQWTLASSCTHHNVHFFKFTLVEHGEIIFTAFVLLQPLKKLIRRHVFVIQTPKSCDKNIPCLLEKIERILWRHGCKLPTSKNVCKKRTVIYNFPVCY